MRWMFKGGIVSALRVLGLSWGLSRKVCFLG